MNHFSQRVSLSCVCEQPLGRGRDKDPRDRVSTVLGVFSCCDAAATHAKPWGGIQGTDASGNYGNAAGSPRRVSRNVQADPAHECRTQVTDSIQALSHADTLAVGG